MSAGWTGGGVSARAKSGSRHGSQVLIAGGVRRPEPLSLSPSFPAWPPRGPVPAGVVIMHRTSPPTGRQNPVEPRPGGLEPDPHSRPARDRGDHLIHTGAGRRHAGFPRVAGKLHVLARGVQPRPDAGARPVERDPVAQVVNPARRKQDRGIRVRAGSSAPDATRLPTSADPLPGNLPTRVAAGPPGKPGSACRPSAPRSTGSGRRSKACTGRSQSPYGWPNSARTSDAMPDPAARSTSSTPSG